MKINTTRGSQDVQFASYEFNITDTSAQVDGSVKPFNAQAVNVVGFFLPVNALVLDGDITVVTPSNESGTATLSIGDSAVANRYASNVDMKSAARTVLTASGYSNAGGLDMRVSLANQNGDATAGKVRVTVRYITLGRVMEVQTH